MLSAKAAVASPLERIICRDRLILALALVVIAALSWLYLLTKGAAMRDMVSNAGMSAMSMPGMPEMHQPWPIELLPLFVMWAVMMVGMMLPSAAPLILLILSVYRRRDDHHTRLNSVLFLGGYLLLWAIFSLAAASGQVALLRAALLSPQMVATSGLLTAAILIVVGVYQWLPMKNACLAHCRSPLSFLTEHWREGRFGAVRMGFIHGLFCVGCCWALMALLFVAGVMNLLWVAAITAFVLVEKLSRKGLLLGRIAGVLLIAWGSYVLSRVL
jgi:predicted metal-binding membrane protein